MYNGITYQDRSLGCWGRDLICVQEKQNGRESWLRGSCHKYDNNAGRWSGGGHANDENISEFNCLERSLLKRGPTRRAYALCVLETRYPCKKPENTSEFKKPSEREYKGVTSEQARSFYGDQPLTDSCQSIKKEKHCSKRIRRDDGRIVNDSISDRVFQSLGNDILIEWLTPEELHNTEIAFECAFDWGRVWHGGKVKDKKTAARIHYDLQRGLQAEYLLEKYDRDLAFSAFWYVLDIKNLIQLAHQYSHLKTIRKLSYFN
tara:strand:+ start:152 stop:934 length:783 start_codon:yes stop_codon:yes gene_type:complete